MNAIIEKLGMGLHNGPFPLTTNGNKPSYRGLDWPGEAGESVIAEVIEIFSSNTIVVIDGKRYNSTCFA
jgi:hypothetical protein